MNASFDSNWTLEVALAQLQTAAALSFEQARPIPPGLNHSQAFLDREKQSVFMQEWICIGREDEIARAGDFLTHSIADMPVLVAAQKGSRKKITCPYHAWTYRCTGELIRAPYMEMKPEFDASQHGLCALHVDCWQGFVYVSVAENPAIRLNEVLAPFTESIVAQRDEWSCSLVKTNRTARSRTSFEYPGRLFIC